MPRQTAAQKAASTAEVTITRQDKRAWWCPICDHSNTHLTARCGGCNAHRDGDTVTP